MKSDRYTHVLNKDYLMGPNCMKLLEEMLIPGLDILRGARVLDLGCGQGLSTLYLALETAAKQIYATDLWISATQMYKNFVDWHIDDRVIPIHADAAELPYADGFFDAVVSVDSYHYFGREEGFFARKIWPLLKPGGYALICMPGVKQELTEYPPLMVEWAEDEVNYFHSVEWWEDNLRSGITELESITAFESALSDQAWSDWFASNHEYSLRDKEFFDRGLGQYVNFASFVVKKTAR